MSRLFLAFSLLLAVVIAATAPGANAAPSPSSMLDAGLMKRLLEPNGKRAVSFDSGMRKIKPCKGAASALRPTWQQAGVNFGLRWQVLAAITQVESGFGCNMGPSSANAIGWTQFIPDTWKRWGTDADGDGKADPYNSVDAVYSTARYLRVTGAPEDYREAIFAYNHANWYVDKVLATADTFEKFSSEEFSLMSDLAAQGEELELQINRLRTSVEGAPAKRRSLSRQLKRARAKLRTSRKQLAVRRASFEKAKTRLDRITLRYINTTQAVAGSEMRDGGSEGSALEYVTGSDPQDAVLVYHAARTIIDQQADVLGELRAAALEAQATRDRLQSLTDERAQAVRDQTQAIQQQAVVARQERQDLANLEQQQRSYSHLRLQYEEMMLTATGQSVGFDQQLFSGDLAGYTINQRVVLLARRELERGVVETPRGSNDSPDIARYRSASSNAPVGPWCAYFSSWIAAQAGAPLMEGGRGSGLVISIREWAKRTGRWRQSPRPGQLIIFDGHMGIVERVGPEGEVFTIEGNSSDAVSRRSGREAKALGYVQLG